MDNLLFKQECFDIVGSAMDVHNELGSGFLEAVYQEALGLVFKDKHIPYQTEVKLNISFKGILLEKYYIADFVCYN